MIKKENKNMAVNKFEKFDKAFDLDSLKSDVTEAASNSSTFKEVPLGDYEVEINKMELTTSKNGDPMFTCWMKIIEGEYAGSMLFMNQVITKGFQIHIVNNFLRALTEGMDINVLFESYSSYADLVLDIGEEIDGKKEFLIAYGERKGFNTFDVKEVYDVE